MLKSIFNFLGLSTNKIVIEHLNPNSINLRGSTITNLLAEMKFNVLGSLNLSG